MFQALRNLVVPVTPAPLFDPEAVSLAIKVMMDSGTGDLKGAMESFRPLLGTPGNSLVMVHTKTGRPLTGRVMSADCRTARLAVGLCYHPGLGLCIATVRSFGATWESSHPDDIKGNTGKDGRLVLNPRNCIFFGPEDMSSSTALGYLSRLASAIGQGRYEIQETWPLSV